MSMTTPLDELAWVLIYGGLLVAVPGRASLARSDTGLGWTLDRRRRAATPPPAPC
ncbi:MAG: hypothetical protein MZW92_56165 [Comamonadaceae bacterium]|nr:hypothetical protein [Comamonadaceae bacterium]